MIPMQEGTFRSIRLLVAALLVLSVAGFGLIGCGGAHQSPPTPSTPEPPKDPAASNTGVLAVQPPLKPVTLGAPASAADTSAAQRVLDDIKSAWAQKDIEALLKLCSESFSGAQGETKAELALVWPQMMGAASLLTDEATFWMAGTEVAAYPLKYVFGASSGTVTFLFCKEPEGWKWSGIRVNRPEGSSQPPQTTSAPR